MSKIRPNNYKDKPKVKINGEWMDSGGNQYEFTRCKLMWFSYLQELNWNPKTINPLERVAEIYSSFWPEVVVLLQENGYTGMPHEHYLKESGKYCDYLSKGGKPYSDKTRQAGWKDPATGEFNMRNCKA